MNCLEGMCMAFQLSVCVEMLFADRGSDFGRRIRAAHAAGFSAVEFWAWRTKDIASVEAVLAETGVDLVMLMSEPRGQLADPSARQAVLEGVEESALMAQRLRCPQLVLVGGERVDGQSPDGHVESAADVLSQAAEIAGRYGRTLVLEPVNASEAPEGWLTDTPTAARIIEAVGSPHLRMLYDVFHSGAMDESPVEMIRTHGHLFGHVHVADLPDRTSPGTGTIGWGPVLAALAEVDYRGRVGLEYLPTAETVVSVRRLFESVAQEIS